MEDPVKISALPSGLIRFDNTIPAGFPVPHTDAVRTRIDLNHELIINANATYLFHVRGESMTGIGIFDGDTIVVDRSIEPQHGHIVLAVLNQEYTVKRLYRKNGVIRLMPENPDFDPIDVHEGDELAIWGVVTVNVRKLLPGAR